MNTTTKQAAIDATVSEDFRTLTLTFSDGRSITIGRDDISTNIMMQATLHGLKQKLVDAAAISRNPDNGKSATIDDKFAAVKEVYDRLLAGQWNKNRADGAVRGGLLFRALCMLYPDKTPDAIRAFLEKKSAVEKTALRNTPKIADIIATLKADEPDTGTDANALLDELND